MLAAGCTGASQRVSTTTSSRPEGSGEAICADYYSLVAAITPPNAAHADPHTLVTKLLAAGTSSSNSLLASEVKALGKASTNGIGSFGFGRALVTLGRTCIENGFHPA